MNKLYTLVGILLMSSVTFGQVTISLDSSPTVAQNGLVVTKTIDESFQNVYLSCYNESGVDANYKFMRTILNSSVSFEDQFCDNTYCYNCSGTTWLSPTSQPVADGDSSIMKPGFTFTSGGTAEIRYYVLDADNGDSFIDSVDVHLTSVVGVGEDGPIEISAYPNPATDVFNINAVTNGNALQVKLFNVLGEEILNTNLTDGINQLDIASLTDGVYFYSILKNNKAVETKKLIVRK